MKKKFLLFCAAVSLAAAPLFFFSIESGRLKGGIERALSSGPVEAKIGGAGLRLPARLVLRAAEFRTPSAEMKVARLELSFSPVRFFSRRPFITIYAFEPSLRLSEWDASFIEKRGDGAGLPVGRVKAENGSVIYKDKILVSGARGEVAVGKERIEGMVGASVFGARAVARIGGRLDDMHLSLNASDIKMTPDSDPAKLSVKCRIAPQGKASAQYKISHPAAAVAGSAVYEDGRYEASARVETESRNIEPLNVLLTGDAGGLDFSAVSSQMELRGKAVFEGGGVAVETSSAVVGYADKDFSAFVSGGVKGFWSRNKSSARAFLSGDLRKGAFASRISAEAAQSDKLVKIKASAGPGGVSADADIDIQSGRLDVRLRDGASGRAVVAGAFGPLDVNFNFRNWNAASVALPSLPAGGTLDAAGDFSVSEAGWKFRARAAAKSAVWKGVAVGECSGDIIAGPGKISVTDAVFDSGKIKGEYHFERGVSRRMSVRAERADIGALSAFAGHKLAGIMDGSLDVASVKDKPPSGRARLSVSGLALDGKVLGDLKTSAVISGEDVNVDHFSLRGPDGSVSGGFSVAGSRVKGLLGFSSYPVYGDLRAAGQLSVSGRYKNPDDFHIALESEKFSLRPFLPGETPLFLSVSSDKASYKIQDLRFGTLRASNVAARKTGRRQLSGDATLKDYPLRLLSKNVDGRLRVDAALSGDLSNPEINIKYRGEEIVLSSGPPAGTLSGSAVYSGGVLRVSESRFRSPRTQVVFSGRAGGDMLDLAGRLTSAGIADVVSAEGLSSGAVLLNFKIAGRPSEPTISFDADINSFKGGGAAMDRVRLAGDWRGGRVNVSSGSLKWGDNEIKLLPGGYYDAASSRYEIKILVSSLRAGFISALGRVSLSGAAPRGVGPPSPAVGGSAALDDFWVGGKKFSGVRADYKIHNGAVEIFSRPGAPDNFALKIETSPEAFSLKADYAGAGKDTIALEAAVRAGVLSADASIAGFPADDLASMLGAPFDVSGKLNATLRAWGRPDNPSVEGRAALYGGSAAGVAFDELSAEASLNDGLLDVVSARALRANAYRVSAGGTLYVAAPSDKTKKPPALRNNFTVTLEDGRLSFLEAFDFVKKAQGPVSGRMELRGTHSDPRLTGFLKIENASAELNAYLAKIENLNLIATVKDNALTVENLSGRSGSGRFLLKGAAKLENFAFSDLDFSFVNTTSAGIDLFIPELPIPTQFSRETATKFVSSYSYGKPRFEITIKGDPRKKFTVAGWARLDHTYFSYPPPPLKGPVDDPAKHVLEKLELDINLLSGENTWYENELVSVSIDGALSIKGNYYAPAVSGSVEAKRGYISYIGNEFKIQSARFEMIGHDAYLEGIATKQIPSARGQDTVQLIIDRSLIGQIQPRFISSEDPSLSSERVFARIVGMDAENMTPQERDLMLRRGLVQLLDSSLATPLAKTLLRRSGVVDLVKVSYAAPASGAGPDSDASAREKTEGVIPEVLRGTKYTFEKYISDAMLLGYSVTLDEYLNRLDLKHEVEVAYRMKGNVFLRGIYELDSKSLIRPPERRITVEQQWRFGWPKK